MSSHAPPPDDTGNLLGALLRLAHQALIREVFDALARTRFSDVQPHHMTAMRPLWDTAEGMRATDLAAAAHVTKQSMGAVLDQLEERGYVERIDDPDDGRAKRVRLTRRGRDVGAILRTHVRRVEDDWAGRVGRGRLESTRQTLRDLVASLAARD
jgi:DNA-binding MarR family transcriptional regulator